MLPTVHEETENLVSYRPAKSSEVLIQGLEYPLDITSLVLGYSLPCSSSSFATRKPGRMEGSRANGESSSMSPRPETSGEPKANGEPRPVSEGASPEKSASDKSPSPTKNGGPDDPEVKPRQNEETQRASGRERENRDGARKNRNSRSSSRKSDKKWWVCPEAECRARNSIDATTCTNCGVQQINKSTSRHMYARNWEKTRVSGLVVTHVTSPTTVYIQTPQQQHDYARLRNCMAMAYASASYRPSLVAANMMLGMKYGDGYERVRTDQIVPDKQAQAADLNANSTPQSEANSEPVKLEQKSAPSSPGGGTSLKWRVQLVDRGSWCEALEDDFNFLLSGLSDLAPLATKYSLNELRLARGASEAQLEESRAWLEQELSSGVIEGDVYKQTRNQSSVLFLDLYKGEKHINKELCRFAAVEPKTNLKWLKPDAVRASTSSSVDEGLSVSPSDSQRPDEKVDKISEVQESHSVEVDGPPKEQRNRRERSPRASKDSTSEDHNVVFREPAAPRRNDGASGGGRRGNQWANRRNGRPRQQKLPPLHDWAVLCFDLRTPAHSIATLCEMVEHAGKDSRVSIAAADSIQMENCDDSAMVSVLADMIAAQPRLLLLLCVLPQHVQDYSALERTGRNLGVCVVCVRGESIADPTPNTATRLLADLQTAMLNSPAILPDQGSFSYGGRQRRRYNRDRRNQKSSVTTQRSTSPGSQTLMSFTRQDGGADTSLQAVLGAASQGVSLLHKLSLSNSQGGETSNANTVLQSSTSQQDIVKAKRSLEELQAKHKQAKAYTYEAFLAAAEFFSHLSHAVAPNP
ncbi:uncharacterized protein LOC108664591 isoform X2 [Hyalella azteca]|uniref:Uncharacterized protein LOC108664591 isoform X2 n=1 Tax=Hyalella azteca TaxID=294128 RepID=A0A8B7MZG9_HYAAZ|nr:uncharacterized protein LOC108664591 isoform X2 [Hyalella azteca]